MHHCTRSLYYRVLTLHITTNKAHFNKLLGSVGALKAGSRFVSAGTGSPFLDSLLVGSFLWNRRPLVLTIFKSASSDSYGII